jgi:hypothetical protein
VLLEVACQVLGVVFRSLGDDDNGVTLAALVGLEDLVSDAFRRQVRFGRYDRLRAARNADDQREVAAGSFP